MNEDSQLPDAAPGSVPGSGAGDAATSQAIPRLPKPAKTPTKKTPTKKAPTKKPDASSAAPSTDPKPVQSTPFRQLAETDKGRTREVTTPPAPPKPPVSDKQSDPAPTTRAEPRPAATLGSPLTAADYARTTTPSPATTSVIPAVKEGPRIAAPSSPPPVAAASSRQANLRLNYVEPWSVARIAFAVSVALMIVGVVAMTIFWVVLNVTGVWGQVNDAVTSVLSDDSSSFDITDYLGFWRLIGLTLVLSAINVVLMTALATIGAHLYNLAAQVLGGVEVTFSEDN